MWAIIDTQSTMKATDHGGFFDPIFNDCFIANFLESVPVFSRLIRVLDEDIDKNVVGYLRFWIHPHAPFYNGKDAQM